MTSLGLLPFVLPLVAALAWLASIGGVGGGVLMLLVLTAFYGLDVAVPTLAITQLVSNGGRVWFNRDSIHWRIVGWFALGAVPFALGGGLVLANLPNGPLKRGLGALLIAMFVWRRVRPVATPPGDKTFIAIGGGTGLASSMLGAAGPLAAPFFLAYGLVGEAYIGTEAAASVTVHLTKTAAYGAGNLLSLNVFLLAATLTPAILIGIWLGKQTIQRMNQRVFVLVIEIGVLLAGIGFLIGL